jgi:hypothetical protein
MLVPAKGIEAVSSVRTFLTRIKVLRDDPDDLRPDTREADRAAVAKLEERKVISPEIETELWEMITLVTGINPTGEVVVHPDAAPEAPVEGLDERQTTAIKLWNWLEEWTGIAKNVITRRDYLITLGLAKRRKRKPKNQDPLTVVTEPPASDPPPVESAPAEPLTTEPGTGE